MGVWEIPKSVYFNLENRFSLSVCQPPIFPLIDDWEM